MAKRVTPEELERRKAIVKDALSRRPELTRCHFQRIYGYSYPFLDDLERTGEVVFGKAPKPYGGWTIK